MCIFSSFSLRKFYMLKDDYLRNHLYKFVLVVTYKPMQKFVISGPLLLLRMRFGVWQQKWTTCPVKIAIFRGLGGGPQNFIFIGILLFL